MRECCWPAPAKLNLFLRIIGRREDGYHELQTVFVFLDFGDELKFQIRDDGVIRRLTQVPGVAESDDLVLRAARLLKGCRATICNAWVSRWARTYRFSCAVKRRGRRELASALLPST